jgi:hypothetical protein
MVDILFISDYVCPHCVVAKAALKAALKETGIEANITWQPYELTWEPAERVDTYHDEKRKAGYQICIEPSKQLGLDAKFPPKVIPRPYSRLAFEGWYFASDHGKGEEYNDVLFVVGRGWNNYKFDEILYKDKSILTGKDLLSYIRNRNLFYVCCSRPKRNLVLFITVSINQEFEQYLKEIFGEDSLIEYSDFIK